MMKRQQLIKVAFLLFVVGLAVTSCYTDLTGSGRSIGFTVRDVKATKSSPITSSSIKSEPYGVFYSAAFAAGKSDVWYDSQNITEYDSEESRWNTGQFWPEKNTDALDFWSYAPVEAFSSAPTFDNAAGKMTFRYSPAHDPSSRNDAKEQYDLIVAYTGNSKYDDSSSHMVPVTFKHALSGVRFKVGKFAKGNIDASDRIRITAVELSGIRTDGVCVATGSATGVDFAWSFGASPVTSKYMNFFTYGAEDYCVTGNYMDSRSTENEPMGEDIFMLIPQTLAGAEITINWQKDGQAYTARTSSLSNVTLEAGKMYTFTLDINEREKQILVVVSEIVPWEYVSSDIDYSHVVSNATPLSFDPATATVSGENVFFKSGREIKARFRLGSPTGSSFFVSLKGDYDAFEVRYPDSERTDRYYSDGDQRSVLENEDCCFSIVPVVADPTREYTATLQICVRTTDGRIINVDDEVQVSSVGNPITYHIVLSSN